MEQGDILSARQARLSTAEVLRRFAARAPRDPSAAPHGDHDLNPDLHEPNRSLVPAAVLVPIVARPTGPSILLTRRTERLDVHAGQVSFPGGRIEDSDQDPEAAALRETEEEVGLSRRHVRLIGRLAPYITRTGFEVIPVVGLVTPPFSITPDRFEVAEVFEAALDFFLTPANRQTRSLVYAGKQRQFYDFAYQGHRIWGATAGMLVDLVQILTADREA